jgi:LruC domain-containing protein
MRKLQLILLLLILNCNEEKTENSSKLKRFPGSSFATIAFEDSFPSSMDGDFNDYIAQFYFEETLNQNQEIESIVGEFIHVAKGSNYSHELKLKLLKENEIIQGNSAALEIEEFDSNQNQIGEVQKINLSDLTESILLLGDSNKTISVKNNSQGSNFIKGHSSKLKLSFAKPITRDEIGYPPYDLYLRILSKPITNTNSQNGNEKDFQEIHLPGKFLNLAGKDLYLDSRKVPYALLIPNIWNWPYEGKDIRNDRFSAYPKFNSWILSNGLQNQDWYKNSVTDRVFPLSIENSDLTAYLNANNITEGRFFLLLIILTFVISILFLRKKYMTA